MSSELVKIELGGGAYSKGNGFTNIDKSEHSDIRYNLSDLPWPLEDESVDEIYSSHWFEHMEHPHAILNEIVRVCRLHAKVTIKVPHPNSDMAMVWDHKHVYSPLQAINVEKYFPKDFWKAKHRLRLINITYGPTILLDEAKRELPFLNGLSDEVIMKWIPRTCHECVFNYVVTKNEYYEHVSHI